MAHKINKRNLLVNEMSAVNVKSSNINRNNDSIKEKCECE